MIVENAATWHTLIIAQKYWFKGSFDLSLAQTFGLTCLDHVVTIWVMGMSQISVFSTTYTLQKSPFIKPKEPNQIPPTLRSAKNPGKPNPGTANPG